MKVKLKTVYRKHMCKISGGPLHWFNSKLTYLMWKIKLNAWKGRALFSAVLPFECSKKTHLRGHWWKMYKGNFSEPSIFNVHGLTWSELALWDCYLFQENLNWTYWYSLPVLTFNLFSDIYLQNDTTRKENWNSACGAEFAGKVVTCDWCVFIPVWGWQRP